MYISGDAHVDKNSKIYDNYGPMVKCITSKIIANKIIFTSHNP